MTSPRPLESKCMGPRASTSMAILMTTTPRGHAVQRHVAFRRRRGGSGLRQLRHGGGFRQAGEDEDRCARQDRARALRPELPRGKSIHRAATWRGRSHPVFGSVRRWLAARRYVSRRAVAARNRRAARIGRLHVRVSRRSNDARNSVDAVVVTRLARSSREVRADAEDPSHAALLPRRLADSPEFGRTGLAARVARRAAFHLPRGTGTRAGENSSQAGLSIPHYLGCNRPRARQRVSR